MTDNNDKQFNRAVDRMIKKKARKSLWVWIFIIFIVAVVTSLFVSYVPIFYDKLIHYNDPTYRPFFPGSTTQPIARWTWKDNTRNCGTTEKTRAGRVNE